MASKKKSKADEAKEQNTTDQPETTGADDQGTDAAAEAKAAAEAVAAAEARAAEFQAKNERLQAQLAAAQQKASGQAAATADPPEPGEGSPVGAFQPDPKTFVIVGSIRGKGQQFRKGNEAAYVETLAKLPGDQARKSFRAHVQGGTIEEVKG